MAVRERRDITQGEVATGIGVTVAAYSRWETGQRVPREEDVAKLAAFFGVTPAYLRYGITEPPRAVAEPLREYIPEGTDAYFARQRAEAEANEKAAPNGGGLQAGNDGKRG